MALVTKTFSDIITFTRTGTSATYFNSAGVLTTAGANVPRFDFNPSTLAAQGLLVEEQRTNLRTYSDAITVANAYGVTNTTLSTVSTSTPISGVTTATLSVLNVGANTGNTQDGLNYGGTVVSNTTQYTQSIFVKPAGATVLRLRNNSLGGTADFILTGNGTAPGLVSGIQAATIAPVGGGWYRCTWTFTTGSTVPGNRMDYWALKSDVADGVNGLYFTGAQFEAGAFPTSYIPTTTTALTRSADVASVNTLSPWFNATEGTLFAEWTRGYTGNFSNYVSPAVITNNLSGASANSIASVFTNGVNQQIYNSMTVNNVEQLDYRARNAQTTNKVALAYKTNDTQQFINGLAEIADISCTVPTSVSQMNIGAGAINSAFINSWIRRITYYPRRLSQAEGIAITT